MIDFGDTFDRSGACASCGASLTGRRYLQADGPALLNACSESCLREVQAAIRKRLWKARHRALKVAIIGLAVAGACLVPHQGPHGLRPAAVGSAPPELAADHPAGHALPAGWFGPEWPPTDTDVLAALGRDAWIHPLAGPVRRMPRTDARVFGAVRPGERPIECRNGHCGVDLGGEIWGEYVRAAHDGVVDFVQRGANPLRGGEFVRISHRGGTVFTQYFHLAAIPRRLERGTFVKSGDVIGLLGDTGVKESAPHLHFAVSIRPSPDRPERYIDPEPLVALWALRVPIEGGDACMVTTVSEPGLPIGSMNRIPGRKQRLAQLRRAASAPSARGEESAASPATADVPASEPAPPEDSGGEGE
jgi:hypothetical protein